MTPAERNAVLEEAAQWHDGKRREALRAYDEQVNRNRGGNQPFIIATIAEIHRTSANAIRALKEQEPTT